MIKKIEKCKIIAVILIIFGIGEVLFSCMYLKSLNSTFPIIVTLFNKILGIAGGLGIIFAILSIYKKIKYRTLFMKISLIFNLISVVIIVSLYILIYTGTIKPVPDFQKYIIDAPVVY